MPLIKYTEDKKHLAALLKSINNNLKKIKKIKKNKEKIIFTIGSTAGGGRKSKPYDTPIRKLDTAYVTGVIIYTQCQAIIVSNLVDGKVDYIFVDAEKKLPSLINPDYKSLKHFKIKLPEFSNAKVEYGNISAICNNFIKKSMFSLYKANDLTVEVTWEFLNNYFTELSGKKILIIGSGNIGTKLSLKLVECGSGIFLHSSRGKQNHIVRALNDITHDSLLSKIRVLKRKKLSSQVDAIIGCTNAQKVITKKLIKNLNKDGIVIDVGKGNISIDALNYCKLKKINTWRTDISPIIQSMVTSGQKMKNFYNTFYGYRQINNIGIVSGGYIGEKNDIIVDNFNNPKIVYGVCDGLGSRLHKLNKKSMENINILKKFIKNKR